MESAGNLQSLFISVPNSSLHFQFQHLDAIYVFVVVLQDPTLSAYMFFKSQAASILTLQDCESRFRILEFEIEFLVFWLHKP